MKTIPKRTRLAVLGLGLAMGLVGVAGAQTGPVAPSTPCLDAPEFDDFDFWVGEWRVEAGGRFAGANSIRKLQNGCVLLEEWQGVGGSSGISLNYFDVASGQWVQTWTGAGGSQILIRGGLKGESMVLTGYITYVGQDNKADFRGTWTPLEDGRVRQFFEQSNDGGKTWVPWFDGYYSRNDNAKGS